MDYQFQIRVSFAKNDDNLLFEKDTFFSEKLFVHLVGFQNICVKGDYLIMHTLSYHTLHYLSLSCLW